MPSHPWHGQPGPGCPALTHSLFGQTLARVPSLQGLTKAGQAEIGSADQLLGTVWVPGLCLQLLPAPGSKSGELGVATV